MTDLRDEINIQKDRRKIQKLIDEGKVTAEQVANAPILEIDPPENPLDPTPEPMRVRKVICRTGDCTQEFKTLAEFEEHTATEHLGYTEAEGDES